MKAPQEDSRGKSGFSKLDRILRRSEFLATQSKGVRVRTSHLTLIFRNRADDGRPRIGITASRKVANSVGRNRIRRLVREVFRGHKTAFPLGFDCVVIVHENVPALSFSQVREEILGALARRGRFQSTPGAWLATDIKKSQSVTRSGPKGAPPRP